MTTPPLLVTLVALLAGCGPAGATGAVGSFGGCRMEPAGAEPVSLPTRRHSGNRRGATGERAPETVWLNPICVHAQRPLTLAIGGNA